MDVSTDSINPGIIARRVRVDELPGAFGKTFVVPPGYAGVVYAGTVGATYLAPGRHTVRGIGAREPTNLALIDAGEFTLEPLSPRLTTADGEPLDWVWRARMCVSDPLKFATRVLAGQPLVDQRALANTLIVGLETAIQNVVQEYDAGTLFDQTAARANIVRRLRAPLDQFCAEHGLAARDFASVDFAPALDEAVAIKQLETGQKQSADERKSNDVRQRVEDQIEQTLLREPKPSKVDKFTQRNARLLAWAERLKLLGGVIVSALTLIGVLAPDLAPNDTALKLGGAAFGLLAALGAFLGSLWLDSAYSQRKQAYERGWLNRLSAERVFDSDAALRARTATELGKAMDTLRDARHRLAPQHTPGAMRLKEIEEKAHRLTQELRGAETGAGQLRMGERVAAAQAQRLMNLETALLRDAEKLTQASIALATLVARAQWDQVDAHIAPLDTALLTMRNRFADRANIL